MFSLENLYLILYTNLLKPAKLADCYFFPFGSTNVNDLTFGIHEEIRIYKNHCFFYDQEPINADTVQACIANHKSLQLNTNKEIIFANSEKSELVDNVCLQTKFKNWYYFFHGFAALVWYRDYQYIPTFENHFTKVFISYNRLVTKDRSYRLNLISHLYEKNLLKHGHVSLILRDNGLGTWREELTDPQSRLSPEVKVRIEATMKELKDGLTIDSDNPPGHASADAGIAEISMHKSALWHLVTETVFYDHKLHLTEKIFKPITAKRPFILVGAPGNLAYLKSYGFKTFDRWVDESYDNEYDPDKRILLIVEQVEKLCSMSTSQLDAMYNEMKPILEYNFQHFYGNFKTLIIDELVDNFRRVLCDFTNSKVDISNINFDHVKNILYK
jgi:hypothetical protein